MKLRSLFEFPNPVNEVSARVVAGGVVVLAALALALQQPWLMAVLAYGFVARVLTGPTLSPLAQLATRVVTPRLPVEKRYVAGPPKRFAQGIGAAITVTAAVLALGFGLDAYAYGLVGMLLVFAALEAFVGFCAGCHIFSLLMRAGLVPAEVCERCQNIWTEREERAVAIAAAGETPASGTS